MHVYKFKITLENHEDFCRVIEILSNHTFEDFHLAILKSIKITSKELASFYICDSQWNKKKEITLVNMTDEEENVNSDKKTKKIILMDNSKLCDFIDEPHQRIIYLYDYLNSWTFYIELVKIISAKPKTQYPCCVKSVGNISKHHTTAFISTEFEEEFSAESFDITDEFEEGNNDIFNNVDNCFDETVEISDENADEL